jgi:3,4-dehydroadipyl-CoA semialdehyde dehydrogenase
METVRIESYLSGRWSAGEGEGAPLFNPATDEQVATASGKGLDLGAALRHAREVGGPALRALTFAERAELVQKLSAALHEHREALIDSAVLNGGCTRGDAKFDVDGAILVFAHYAEVGRALGARRILPDGDGLQLARTPRFWGQHVYVPRAGVAVLINAFNFPTWGFAEKMACALVAGVPVLTKPATSTALTAYRAAQVIVGSGILPEGAFSFLGGSAGDLLDHLTGQDLLAFTGGAATGRKLRAHPRVVAESVPVNIEADSLNAAVLGPDVALGSETMNLFLREVSREITQKSGQKCTAVRRIFLPEALAADVIPELGARLGELKIGDPSLAEVRMGPLASADQLRDVKAGVALLREEADVVWGAPDAPVEAIGVPAGKGCFFAPVLLKARDPESARHVHEHEVFGPVATVLVYDGSAEKVAAWVNKGGGGLVASVYSDDRDFTERVTLGIAPYHGRVYLGSEKMAAVAMGPGLVLPQCVHGGPGRAGGGEELGGERGVKHFMQRTALQGARPTIESISGTRPE